ncbi:class I SAM-dependent methyltransferase [Leifsonia lichenia]
MSELGRGTRWERGDAYERFVGRWSAQLAVPFLDGLGLGDGLDWLDVGCGTGALTAAVLERCAPASIVGIEPSAGFLRLAAEKVGGRAELLQGRADALPVPSASRDVVVFGLVLNFVPDAQVALAEAVRVTRPGGTIAATVWDYGARMEFLRIFWDAAVELDQEAVTLDEAVRFPLSDPHVLRRAFEAAGLTEVAVRAIETPTVFADFDDYWRPFLGGQGPAPGYVAGLDARARDRLRDHLIGHLPVAADGTIPLSAGAWAISASRAW